MNKLFQLTAMFAIVVLAAQPFSVAANSRDRGHNNYPGEVVHVENHPETNHGNHGVRVRTLKMYGRIDSAPVGLVGTWRVAERSFEATAATRFEQRYGSLVAGTCVELAYFNNNGIDTLSKVEAKQSYKCR